MDPILKPLLQYGVLGIFSILLILFARQAVKREQMRADALEAENKRLNTVMQEKIIPALTLATQAIVSAQTVMQGIQYQRDVERALSHGEPGPKVVKG